MFPFVTPTEMSIAVMEEISETKVPAKNIYIAMKNSEVYYQNSNIMFIYRNKNIYYFSVGNEKIFK